MPLNGKCLTSIYARCLYTEVVMENSIKLVRSTIACARVSFEQTSAASEMRRASAVKWWRNFSFLHRRRIQKRKRSDQRFPLISLRFPKFKRNRRVSLSTSKRLTRNRNKGTNHSSRILESKGRQRNKILESKQPLKSHLITFRTKYQRWNRYKIKFSQDLRKTSKSLHWLNFH